uniref:Oxidation resistance protein 1 n=2 Tax=Lactuca sativa TaxID=4236 RepID=A0A9R1XCR6_LACSA|nr:hypothetical protein LSAT_V11C400218390 [Lactuca sativa]
MNDTADLVVGLPSFATGITDDDLRESAYEILLAAVGASGYLLSPFCFVALSYYSWACVSKFPTLTNIDLNMLEEGLVNHPVVGFGESGRKASEMRILLARIEESESFAPSVGELQRIECLRSLREIAIALAERPARGDLTGEVCHWADGYHLNVRLYEKLLSSIFDVLDEGKLTEEVEKILELLKSTWRILGITETIHHTGYAWVLFRQFVKAKLLAGNNVLYLIKRTTWLGIFDMCIPTGISLGYVYGGWVNLAREQVGSVRYIFIFDLNIVSNMVFVWFWVLVFKVLLVLVLVLGFADLYHLLRLLFSDFPSDKLPKMSEPSQLMTENTRSDLYVALLVLSQGKKWVLLYSTWRHGISLSTLYRRSNLCPGLSLLVVGDRKGAVFGGLVEAPLKPSTKKRYQGSNDTFVFTNTPGRPVIYRPTGVNRYFTLCSTEYLALGGGNHFALYLDSDL